jgi:hypothetical protein
LQQLAAARDLVEEDEKRLAFGVKAGAGPTRLAPGL